MYPKQVVPIVPHKRSIRNRMYDHKNMLSEEPTRKKLRIFEKSCLTHPSDAFVEPIPVKKPKKTVTFSEDTDEVYFHRIDSTRSLLNDGIDPYIEEWYPNMDLPGYSPTFKPLTPEQKTLKRTISYLELDQYWGDDLDSQFTDLHLGKVKS